MVGQIAALADAILGEIAVAQPVHPFYIALVAQIPLCPVLGLRDPAAYADGVLYFDDTREGWRAAAADLICGALLEECGLRNTDSRRAVLAVRLGLERGTFVEPDTICEQLTAACCH